MRASRKWVAVAIAFAAGSLALWPAGAGAAPIDTASDHAALVAYDSYVEGLLSSLPAAHVAVADYVSSISARCPDVLAPIEALPPVSVNGGAALAIGEELGEDLAAAAYPALRAPSTKLAATLAQLRWSSPQTNRTISGFVAALSDGCSRSARVTCARTCGRSSVRSGRRRRRGHCVIWPGSPASSRSSRVG